MKTVVWFENVSESDARALVAWWNAHIWGSYFFVRAHPTLKGRRQVIRQ